LPEGAWPTVAAHLLERFGPAIGVDKVTEMLRAGRFVTTSGPVDSGTAYEAGLVVWFHRDFAPEPVVAGPVGVVYQDERIVVADKPHFLATTPRGSHITQTALARLRLELGLPRLQPAHRLDRLTAGLVLFVVDPALRGAYQMLFQRREVRKQYEALAPYDPLLVLPKTVRSLIVKERGVQAAREEPGEPNSESRISLTNHQDGVGRYLLEPHTGRTHQLRVHMSSLGVPILNDPLYPAELPEDLSKPLQLLAKRLEFTDPVTGEPLEFTSRLALSPSPLAGRA
jgi:tRNA pseudouridine32 synthase/23S rRNA pseudouridine746 synthase